MSILQTRHNMNINIVHSKFLKFATVTLHIISSIVFMILNHFIIVNISSFVIFNFVVVIQIISITVLVVASESLTYSSLFIL